MPRILRHTQAFWDPQPVPTGPSGGPCESVTLPTLAVAPACSWSRLDLRINDLQPVRAWLEVAGIHRGPVFRRMRRVDTVTDQRLSDQSVALIVDRRAQASGLPPRCSPGIPCAPGYATAAAATGIEERKIANVTTVTRHRNLPVLRGYIGLPVVTEQERTLIWRRVCQGGRLKFRRELVAERCSGLSQEGGTSGSVTALPV